MSFRQNVMFRKCHFGNEGGQKFNVLLNCSYVHSCLSSKNVKDILLTAHNFDHQIVQPICKGKKGGGDL